VKTSRIALSALTVVGLFGCGAGQTRIGSVFTTNWEDDRGASISKLEQRLRGAPVPAGADVAVGVTDEGLVGVPLGGGSPWSYAHAQSGRPDIAGAVVVGSGGGELFCLQASTGSLLWKRPTGGLELIGAGDDGRTTVVTLQATGGKGSTVLALARDGSVLRQLETDKHLGQPAVLANIAFIPWQNQYVSAYDISSGDEVARITVRQQTSHAFVENGTLYFGEIGLTRFDDKVGGASQGQASTLTLPDKEIVGASRWLQPATENHGTTAGALDKVRVYARPTGKTEPMAIDGGLYYSTYYRIVFGLAAGSAQLRWVHAHGNDILAGAAFKGGVAVCDADGKVTFLEDKTGLVNGELALGKPVKSCVVQADGLTRAPSGKAAPSLAEQMGEALRMGAHDLVTAQRFLLRELANHDDPEVTKVLVDLAGDARTSPALLPEVRSILASRRTGAEHMLAALSRPYDFLHDVLRPPPVGPIADALAAMDEKKGAPLLARHLNDPQTPPEDVKRAAAALLKLGGEAQLPELEAFFSLYRCTAENEDIATAVVTIAEALTKIGGQRGKEVVARGANDPMTLPAIKQRISAFAEGVTVPADPAFEVPGEKKPAKGAKKKG
jgi:outer membrane protein assembly factor BamB